MPHAVSPIMPKIEQNLPDKHLHHKQQQLLGAAEHRKRSGRVKLIPHSEKVKSPYIHKHHKLPSTHCQSHYIALLKLHNRAHCKMLYFLEKTHAFNPWILWSKYEGQQNQSPLTNVSWTPYIESFEREWMSEYAPNMLQVCIIHALKLVRIKQVATWPMKVRSASILVWISVKYLRLFSNLK